MKKERIIYLIITIIFLLIAFTILKNTNMLNNVNISKSVQIILILYLIRVAYGCTLYIKKQYSERKYSYGIIMNLGLLLFITINILRMISLLIANWNNLSIIDIYNNTLESFSFFAMLTLPCIIGFSVFAIITNIILIKKEGFSYKNLLGIVLGVFALINLFGSQAIYLLTAKIYVGNQLIMKKLLDTIINIVLSYFYSLIIATLYCNIKAAKHIPNFDKDYIIILGSMIRKNGTLPPLLKARVDKAIEFAKMQKEKTGKDLVYVPSGGKGSDEIMPEAEAIKNYLIKQGIAKKNILIENKSTNTLENMRFSNNIILKHNKDAKISFSTTNYHVFRSGVIANNCGIECEGMGSKSVWYFYTNALIREFIANIIQERKRHLALIFLMNISAMALIYVGYTYQLINF